MDEEYMLSTIDNPYNPFTDFDKWLNFDHEMGYDSCELFARLAATSEALPYTLNNEELNNVLHDIVDDDFNVVRILVKKED